MSHVFHRFAQHTSPIVARGEGVGWVRILVV